MGALRMDPADQKSKVGRFLFGQVPSLLANVSYCVRRWLSFLR